MSEADNKVCEECGKPSDVDLEDVATGKPVHLCNEHFQACALQAREVQVDTTVFEKGKFKVSIRFFG